MFFGILILDPNRQFCMGYRQTVIEKDHLGDWSPEKDCCSQDSNHPDDLFQSRYVTPGFKPFSYLAIGKMADFQNGLISGIFGVSLSGFLHRTTLMCMKNRFLHVFWNFNF